MERALQDAQSVDLVLEQGVSGWTAPTRSSKEAHSSVQTYVRMAAKMVGTPDLEQSFLPHDAAFHSEEFPNQVRSMLVKHNVIHVPNTFHQQSHNACSICIGSGTSRSAAGANTVSEARHVRTRIRPGLTQETTHEWA